MTLGQLIDKAMVDCKAPLETPVELQYGSSEYMPLVEVARRPESGTIVLLFKRDSVQ